MANEISTNTAYVDTGSSEISSDPTRLKGVIITAVGGAAQVILQDNRAVKANVMDVRIPSTDPTLHINLSLSPVMFANGIFVGTLSNAVVTLILERA